MPPFRELFCVKPAPSKKLVSMKPRSKTNGALICDQVQNKMSAKKASGDLDTSICIQYILCECGKTFPTQKDLRAHLLKEHPRKRERKEYKCGVCGAIYTTEDECIKHYEASHYVDDDHQSDKPHDADPGTADGVEIEAGEDSKMELADIVKTENDEQVIYQDQFLMMDDEEVVYDETVIDNEVANKMNEDCGEKLIYDEDLAGNRVIYYDGGSCSEEVTNGLQVIYKEEIMNGADEVVEDDYEQVQEFEQSVETYYECDSCQFQFKNEAALTCHFKFILADGCNTDLLPCPECGYNFATQELLKKHLQVHQSARTVYTCTLCMQTFTMARALASHRWRVHGQVQAVMCTKKRTAVTCEICAFVCSSRTGYVHHMRTHTGEKPFQCGECGKGFPVHQRLLEHIRVHTNERPYACEDCPKAFKNKAALNRHLRVHTGVKPYTCPVCGKAFSQSNSMKQHHEAVHLKTFVYKRKNKTNKESS